MDYRELVSSNIKKQIYICKINPDILSELSKVNKKTIKKYIDKNAFLDIDELYNIAKALNITLPELTGDELFNKLCDFRNELWICYKRLEVFKLEASNLRTCANTLYLSHKTASFTSITDNGEYVREHLFLRPSTYRMLWAFAFENLLKGYLLFLHKKSNPDNLFLKMDIISTHDIIKLCENCKIELSSEQKYYFKVLSLCSVTYGRYPLPTKPENMPKKRNYNVKSSKELGMLASERIAKVELGILDRFDEEYDSYNKMITEDELKLYEEFYSKIYDLY